jgi:hypothetical protein
MSLHVVCPPAAGTPGEGMADRPPQEREVGYVLFLYQFVKGDDFLQGDLKLCIFPNLFFLTALIHSKENEERTEFLEM